MRPLRILFVSHRFIEDSVGGTEVLCRDLAGAIAACGHEVAWLAVRPDRTSRVAPPRPVSPGSDPEVFRIAVSPRFASHYPLQWREQEEAVAQEVDLALGKLGVDFDIVHVVHFARIGLAFLDLPILARARLFFTLTDYTAVCPDFQLFRRKTRAICEGPDPHACMACLGAAGEATDIDHWRARNLGVLGKRADGIFVQTPYQRRVLSAAGVPHEKILYDLGCYAVNAASERSRALTRRVYRFAYFGRFSVEKGLDVLLGAVERLGRDRCECHVFGLPDDDYEPIRARIAATPGCILRAPVPHRELQATLAEIDCLLVPSMWLENHPTIISYALASGADVICSSVPSLTHLHGTPGMYFAAPGDPDAWCRQMASRLESYVPSPSPAVREARSLGPDYSFDHLVELTVAAYHGASAAGYAAHPAENL